MRKFIGALLVAALLLCPGYGATAAQGDSAKGPEQSYTVVFKNASKLPDGYEAAIKSAGGKIAKPVDQVGATRVVSSDPAFLSKMEQSNLVENVGKTKMVYPERVVFRSQPLPKTVGQSAELYEEYQWDIKQVTNNGKSWSLPHGTGKTSNGRDVVIAVVDTGVDYNHPDLKANYKYGKSFVPGLPDPGDENGHGTHVAGTIAANGLVMGVGTDLKIASYRVFGPENQAPSDQVVAAIIAAADDKVDVMNLSFAGYDWLQDPTTAPKDVIADVKMFYRSIQYAINKGVVVVNSAGNEGIDITNPFDITKQLFGQDAQGPTFKVPGNRQTIQVSATNQNKELAFYSNYGWPIDIAAPGGDLGPNFGPPDYDMSKADMTKACFSTFPGGGYQWAVGTSQAAPKVSAVAGLIIAKYGKGKLSPMQVGLLLSKSSENLHNRKKFGSGMVNAVKALK